MGSPGPITHSGTFEKITLNVPDKMKTTGSGNFSFTGNWFPFLLKGNYVVSDGLMTKEFGGEQASGDGSRVDARASESRADARSAKRAPMRDAVCREERQWSNLTSPPEKHAPPA